MRPLFAVYAVGALVLAGAAGPILQDTRDGALADLKAMSEPRPLSEFGFLKAARPYLPPVVVDWIIYEKGSGIDLPPGADIHIDEDGTLIVTWPDGCSETYKQGQRSPGAECGGEDPRPVCGPNDEAGDPCEVQCGDGERFDTDAQTCMPSPDCSEGNSAGAGDGAGEGGGSGETPGNGSSTTDDTSGDATDEGACPPPRPPCAPADDGSEGSAANHSSAAQQPSDGQDGCIEEPPLPPCDENEAHTRDGDCAPLGQVQHLDQDVPAQPGSLTWDLSLLLPNDAFWLELVRSNRPDVSYDIILTHEDGTPVCWEQLQEDDDPDPCVIRLTATGRSTDRYRFDANLSAWLDDDTGAGLSGGLELRVTTNGLAGETAGSAPFRPLTIDAYGNQVPFPDQDIAADAAESERPDGADGSDEG